MIILATLILIQIILVTIIFENIKLDKDDKNYSKKKIFKVLGEFLTLLLLISMLTYNYLVFLSVSKNKSLRLSILVSMFISLGYVGFNWGLIKNLKLENFSFSKIPSLYKNRKHYDNLFRHPDLYPFSLDSFRYENEVDSLTERSNMQFNNNGPQEKLLMTT